MACPYHSSPCTKLPHVKQHLSTGCRFVSDNEDEELGCGYTTLPGSLKLREALACLNRIESATEEEVDDLQLYIQSLFERVPEDCRDENPDLWEKLRSTVNSKKWC